MDHQSTSTSYFFPDKIYGAMYSGVPTAEDIRWVSLGIICETPKSISFITLSWFLEEKTQFYGWVKAL